MTNIKHAPSLQATYLPDRHAFALWLPPGDGPVGASDEAVLLAIPRPDGTVAPTEVSCRVVTADALPQPADRESESLTAWRRLLADPAAEVVLPPAAHAVPDALGHAMTSARYASATLTSTVRLADELRTGIRAELRGYQVRGVGWLTETVAGFGGAVLADEMGLGKTLQAIGHLVHTAPARTAPALIVCPTSLVTNWIREIDRFAPQLRPVARRADVRDEAGVSDEAGVVVIGYPTLRLHAAAFAATRWSTVVFDEAQYLKNPRTQVSKAARSLQASARIALTGTPVENHLDELWALLDLVARSRFGNRALFRRRYALPIQQGSADAMHRLRAAIAPVVLARSKRTVAGDLPAKIHTDVACDLTAEQAERYDRLLDEAVDAGFGDGAQRHGRVLALLTRLKQVCNHPVLAASEPRWHAGTLAGRSGKLDACTDILAANLEAGDATIVFTQYRQTGDLLTAHVAEQFGVHAPFLHGGLSSRERDAIVDDFQSGAGGGLLVASVKAAGTGLTLTRAADVVHFDRWWNPAVEAQATDRVHRIGQTRVVTVTTLTTAGTVEEHIAAMHRRKSALRLDADSSALAALTALSDEGLIEVLRRTRTEGTTP